MLLDNYIMESEQLEFQKEACDKIDKYREVRKKMQECYKEFFFKFPYTSENNYRDDWFHYRKIYKERSLYETISQIAAFEEHIQRAEKDSLVFFFQRVCESLEFWYFLSKENITYSIKKEDLEDALKIYDSLDNDNRNGWVAFIRRGCNGDIQEYAYKCVFIAKNRILIGLFTRDVQKILHNIKNILLVIRIGGARIYRTNEPGEYFEKFIPHYKELVEFCNKYKIKELLEMSDVIKEVLNL